MHNPTNNEKENNDINVNKNYLDSYNKNNRTCKHHRQKLKYVNKSYFYYKLFNINIYNKLKY